MKEIAPRITVDAGIKFGKPVIKGTRIPVEILVGKMAGGMTAEAVAEAYGVTRDDVLAALQYAAQAIEGEHVVAA